MLYPIQSFQGKLYQFVRIGSIFPAIIAKEQNCVILYLYWYEITNEQRANWLNLSEQEQMSIIRITSWFLNIF